jgi:hypothetical protein
VNGYGEPVTEWWQAGQGASRVLRSAVVAVVAVALALVAYLLSGGSRPPAATLAAAVVAMAVVTGLVTRRRRTATGLLLGLGGSQLLLHQWFALATPGECAAHLVGPFVPGMHLVQTVLPWGALAQTARACAGTGDASATMITLAVTTHTLAALLTGALITRGETLLASAIALVLPGLPTAVPVQVAPRHAAVWAPRTFSGATAGRYVDRRGPPAAAACPA